MPKKLLLAVTLVTTIVAAAHQAIAQERIRLAWAGASPSNSPIWAVQARKFWVK